MIEIYKPSLIISAVCFLQNFPKFLPHYLILFVNIEIIMSDIEYTARLLWPHSVNTLIEQQNAFS